MMATTVMKELMKIFICTNVDFRSWHTLGQEISRKGKTIKNINRKDHVKQNAGVLDHLCE